MEKKEPELIDYFRIVWKHKWSIGLGTMAFIIIAGAFSFLAKPVYEIDAIVQPGNFMVQDQAGNLTQVVVENPQQVANKVLHKSYDAVIADRLGIKVQDLPVIRAENIKTTMLARFWIRSGNIELGKEVLRQLIDMVRADIDKKIEIEINNVVASIKSNEIQKQRSLREIEILNKKLKIIAQRKKDIQGEMQWIKEKIAELEKEQSQVLRKEDRNETESLAMLLYSNEIQQSLHYDEVLNEKLSQEKLQEEDTFSAITDEQSKIYSYENAIKNLEERKGRFDYTKIIKNPIPGSQPVFPRKGMNIFLALIVGIVIFTVIAFLIEYAEISKAERI